MNPIMNGNIVNDDYIMPCSFNDIDDLESSDNPLADQLNINLNSVSEDDGFSSFESSFIQDATQIVCEDVGSEGDDESLFPSRKDDDIVCDIYSPYDTQDKEITSVASCNQSAVSNSITKTLRNIKRIPSLSSALPSDPTAITLDSVFKSSYDLLSCTVLIDTSNKNLNLILPNANGETVIDEKQLSLGKESKGNFPRSKSEKFFQCSECDKQFREKSHLISHSRAHQDLRKFKCYKCEMSFKTMINYRFHLESHIEEPLKCASCDKVFSVRRALRRHVRVVHCQEKFECDQCGRNFKLRKNLIHHYGVHSGIRPFACTVCDKTFLHRSTLKIHLKEHATAPQGCHDCTPSTNATGIVDSGDILATALSLSCGALIESDVTTVPLVVQQPCHHSAHPFLCSTCGKSFKLKSSLITHMKTHTSDKNYKCEECDKVFKKKQSYELHIKKHRGERPEFMCDRCSQSYYSQFSLRRHYAKHTSQRNFTCHICSKRFWMKDALQVHVRSHSKVRSFNCTLCDKGFSHKSTLVSHTRTIHHELNPLQVAGRVEAVGDTLLN